MAKVLVYRYGLLPPVTEYARVHEQIRLGHEYHKMLVEIERGRRIALCSAVDAQLPKTLIDAARDQQLALDAVLAEIRSERKATRARSESEALRGDVATLRKLQATALAEIRQKRKDVMAESAMALELARINALATELQKNARAHSGVYWGTYQITDDAMNLTRKMPLWDDLSPNLPQFPRWNGGDGMAVGIQIPGGMSIDHLFDAAGTMVKIDAVNERAWHSDLRWERRKHSRTVLRLRIESDENKKPIFADFPMVMHRPLPEGSRIKRVVVRKTFVGASHHWHVLVTLDMDAASPEFFTGHGQGAVALDIGWRQMGDELRLGIWRSADGESGEIRLGAWELGGLAKSDSLRSIRDRNFNECREALSKLLLGEGSPELPAEFRKRVEHLPQWRSMMKMAVFVKKYWQRNRFAGDEDAYELAEKWRYHEFHLWNWEEHQRRGTIGLRRQKYREQAVALATKYETLVLEEFNLTKVARREDTDNDTARSNRQAAAVSTLRADLIHAFERRGGTVVFVKSFEPTTIRCHACEEVTPFDKALNLSNTCPKCNATWDQDDNAARNLLTAYLTKTEKLADKKTPRTARWQAVRERRQEREKESSP